MGSPHGAQEQRHQQQESEGRRSQDARSTPPRQPCAPRPENDAGIVPEVKSPGVEADDLTADNVDIFTLNPVSALRLLCRNLDSIVRFTGDVPPTPPVSSPKRSVSVSVSVSTLPSPPRKDSMNQNLHVPGTQDQFVHEHIDGIPFKKTPIGSPDSGPWEAGSPEQHDLGYNAPSVQMQYSALARKFYSKRPPPISTEDYLLRMHKYCPMSTTVYLATSCYITRLACVDKIVAVTPRNVHRLLLAGLRVAMKALEDLSWPHARFSKVGGVSETELGRLEVTFCFLMDFGLRVDAPMLQTEAQSICRTGSTMSAPSTGGTDDVSKMELRIPESRIRAAQSTMNSSLHTPTRTPEKRKASSALPNRPAFGVGAGGIEVMGQS